MYFAKWATEFPDKPAVIETASGRHVTFKQLNDRSNQLAQLMWAEGLRPGDHIAVFMENHLCYFDAIWAALRSGLYLTTINRYLTTDEAGYILDNCEAKLLLTSKSRSDVAKGLAAYAPRCKTWLMVDGVEEGFDDYEQRLSEHDAVPLAEEREGQFMLYSSGTTGRPKGIKRPLKPTQSGEQQVAAGTMQNLLWGFDENSVYLSPAPMYHSAPVNFTSATLALGGTVAMMPRFDELAALKAIEQFRVTHSQWVPTMFTRMLKLPQEQRSGFDLSSHQVAIHAAAPCPKGIKQNMFDWWGPILYEYFSSTEGNGFTHCGPEEWLQRPGTVGRSLLGIPHVCNEEGEELPVGEAGVLYFENPEVPFQYYKDEGKTNTSQHPLHADWTSIGDMGYIDEEGYVFLTDRISFMIISGGVNIYPQEIEDVLIMHPSVRDVAVIGVPDAEMGEAVKAIVQKAKQDENNDNLAADLIDYARENLAHYKCPRSVDFVNELPRLPTGKLYKRILKDAYWKTGSD